MEMWTRNHEEPKQNGSNLEQQIESVKREVRELGRVAGTDAKRELEDVRARGEDLYERVRTKSRETVERHPLVALVAAAGLGALSALLLTRS